MSTALTPFQAQSMAADEEAMDLRIQGCSYRQIANRQEISVSTAHTRVMRALERWHETAPEQAAELVQIETARLDEMQAALWPKARKGDQQAVYAVLAIMERRSRLLGIDAGDGFALVNLGKEYRQALHRILDVLEEKHPDAAAAVLKSLNEGSGPEPASGF